MSSKEKVHFDSAVHKMAHLYETNPHFKVMSDAIQAWLAAGHHETAVRVAVQHAAYITRQRKQK